MKKEFVAVFASALLLSGNVCAGGDVAAGKAIYEGKGCSGCHGIAGKTTIPNTPPLAGRDAAFVEGALADFKSGKRQNVTMTAMAGILNATDTENVAAYIATLK